VWVDQQGKEFVAQFPDEVGCVTQYGASIKANAVYMSMFQLIPYERLQTHFAKMFDIPISTGTLYNFNLDAYRRLMPFFTLAKKIEDLLDEMNQAVKVAGGAWRPARVISGGENIAEVPFSNT
jgi:hypothetical protein